MNSKRVQIIFALVFFVLAGLSIALPYKYICFFHSENERLTIVAILVTAVAAILTFFVALLLFEKLGIERILQEKATLLVIDLLGFLRGNTISVFARPTETGEAAFRINLFDPFSPSDAEYHSLKVVFPVSYFEALDPLVKMGNSLLMDKRIAAKINLISFFILSYDVDSGNRAGYAQIRLSGVRQTEGEQFGRFNYKDMTLLELLKIYDDIRSEAIVWLNKNCKTKYPLNI